MSSRTNKVVRLDAIFCPIRRDLSLWTDRPAPGPHEAGAPGRPSIAGACLPYRFSIRTALDAVRRPGWPRSAHRIFGDAGRRMAQPVVSRCGADRRSDDARRITGDATPPPLLPRAPIFSLPRRGRTVESRLNRNELSGVPTARIGRSNNGQNEGKF